MEASRRQVELLEKNRPRQQRAIKTYEAILDAAGELLVEVGLERISTNIIAERAGITVPALYRYFPNKYAVLNALGARLMDLQNRAFAGWHHDYVEGKPPEAILEHIEDMLRVTFEVTRSQVGGLQTMHALQAIAPLQDVRLKSHWTLADVFGRIWAEQFGVPFGERTQHRARVAVEMGFMTVMLALEDQSLDTGMVLGEGARALSLYLNDVMAEAGAGITELSAAVD
jgi:AcrR family transcriptional regulator